MNVLRLGGCTLEPLGSYLKALSVLRLVSEQADGSARGWWDRGSFCLETELDEDRLVAFFLESYAPTPILSPWNGGSGFYPKDRKVGIQAIAGSSRRAIRGLPGSHRTRARDPRSGGRKRRIQSRRGREAESDSTGVPQLLAGRMRGVAGCGGRHLRAG